ncbi:MAG: serine/threonine protein kinase [Sandaracinaceae bacterium]|nr:serine/threonine protein kinase [Sandaracinaceae bacterium]
MAEIYLARQRAVEGVERLVILKRILERYADDVEFVTMFLDEARLLAALSHPNIAQVFDVGKVDGTYFLTMEYVRGPTLGHLLAATRNAGGLLPHKEAIGIALSIAEALAYAHERRDEVGRPLDIVHRDLNPANVMVSYDGAVKLIDFGIAKAATKVYETRAGVIKGTYGYIAPEQLVGTTRVDRRADVFAMGILLYEMVVGHHPYDVSDEPNLIDRILEARYRRPRDVRPEVPRDLDRLIASCLTPHPEGRPDDMGELIDALTRHLGEQGLVPTLGSLATLTRRLVPDEEGPRPMRPLTHREARRPFGNDPSGTRRLPLGGATKPTPSPSSPPARSSPPASAPPPRTSPATPNGRAAAPAAPRARVSSRPAPEWTSSPIDDDEPLTIAENPRDGQVPTDSMIHAPEMDSDVATLHRFLDEFPIPQEEEEALTTLIPLGATPASQPPPRAVEPPRRNTPTSGAPPAPEPEPGPPTIVYVALALGGIVAVGVLAYGIVRFLGAEDEGALPGRSPDVIFPPQLPAEEVRLRITSDPPGARVYVDGVAVEGVTPLTARLRPSSTQVWLRLTLDGYVDQERQVLGSAGEARFVLPPIRGPDDPPDLDLALDPPPEEATPDGSGSSPSPPQPGRRGPRPRRR